MKKYLATLAAGSVIALAVPSVASAKDGDIRRSGTCTGNSTSKIKLSPENGRIETEFEVDQNRNGRTWNVTISDNGVVVVGTTAVTQAPSGSFTVRRLLTNRAGADNITARATNPATGESCTASATF